MPWFDLPIVAFDTETTGLNPESGDRVIEFAAVVFRINPRLEVVEERTHTQLFSFSRSLAPIITQITGLTDADLRGAPPFSAHATAIHSLLSSGILIAHNITFDRRFLTAEFERVGLHWPKTLAEIDTLKLSRAAFPGVRGHKLTQVVQRLGLPMARAHRADADARATGLVFLSLARQAPLDTDDVSALDAWAQRR